MRAKVAIASSVIALVCIFGYVVYGFSENHQDKNQITRHDKYMQFFTPAEARDFMQEIVEGRINSIGAEVTGIERYIRIIHVLKDGPAAKAGPS